MADKDAIIGNLKEHQASLNQWLLEASNEGLKVELELFDYSQLGRKTRTNRVELRIFEEIQ